MSAADKYRQAEQICGADPIEAGLVGSLADHECIHCRLPNDGTRRCGCWPEEGAVLAVAEKGRTPLPPAVAREIIGLCRAGLTIGATVTVVNRYFHASVEYEQVKYYLSKSGVQRPKIAKGKVVSDAAV